MPCFTLRSSTERPITVSEGTNRVLGVGSAALASLKAELRQPLSRDPRAPEGWDGRAGLRAADAIAERYGRVLSAQAAPG